MKPSAVLEPRASVDLGDYVIDCAWSSDGRRLAVACSEGAVHLCELGEGESRAHELGEHALGALAVSWQPGAARFASAGQDGTVAIWDAGARREQARFRPGRSSVEAIAFSPDGRLLATASGRLVALWSAEAERLHDFPPAPGAIAALAWDRPGRDLAVATNGGLLVHRVEPPRFATRRYARAGACLTAAPSPNGKVLAAGTQDGSVHFWYLTTGRDSQMRGYDGKVQLTVWSSNGRYLATGAGADIVVWDFGGKGPEGSRPIQLRGHTGRIETLAFQPNGPWLVSGGRDWRVALWQPGKVGQAVDVQLGDAEATVARFSPDGRFVAVGQRNGRLAFHELRRL